LNYCGYPTIIGAIIAYHLNITEIKKGSLTLLTAPLKRKRKENYFRPEKNNDNHNIVWGKFLL
jgi:hypothetical protein